MVPVGQGLFLGTVPQEKGPVDCHFVRAIIKLKMRDRILLAAVLLPRWRHFLLPELIKDDQKHKYLFFALRRNQIDCLLLSSDGFFDAADEEGGREVFFGDFSQVCVVFEILDYVGEAAGLVVG